jgi:hypothetical protein
VSDSTSQYKQFGIEDRCHSSNSERKMPPLSFDYSQSQFIP